MVRSLALLGLLVFCLPTLGGCGPSTASRRRALLARRAAREPTEYRDVTTGQYHTCATVSGGRVACWGLNDQGQVGDGTRQTRDRPVIASIRNAVDVDAGAWQTCAILDGGSVECWGGGHERISHAEPTPLKGLEDTARLVAVGLTTCTITLTGKVLCWTAKEGSHAVGHGPPYLIPLVRPAIALDVGTDILCALMAADDMACFYARNTRFGYSFEAFEPPVRVQDLQQLSVGGNHACATGLGPMVCWGDNSHGQVGEDPREWIDQPIYVDVGYDVIHVSVGWNHSCAATAGGEVLCWGDNSHGQLGDGTRTSRRTAEVVQGIPEVALRVAAGRDHSCAVTLARTLYCWGRNGQGQLGLGDRQDRLTGTRVLDPITPRARTRTRRRR